MIILASFCCHSSLVFKKVVTNESLLENEWADEKAKDSKYDLRPFISYPYPLLSTSCVVDLIDLSLTWNCLCLSQSHICLNDDIIFAISIVLLVLTLTLC